jgi:1-aminocyclopropane-1-carboxylate deaminase/D-cysteine desulfhydrase-like pyridoxal-dependent ACC family enzyme
MAALIAKARAHEIAGTTLFWHTGGQVGLFAA